MKMRLFVRAASSSYRNCIIAKPVSTVFINHLTSGNIGFTFNVFRTTCSPITTLVTQCALGIKPLIERRVRKAIHWLNCLRGCCFCSSASPFRCSFCAPSLTVPVFCISPAVIAVLEQPKLQLGAKQSQGLPLLFREMSVHLRRYPARSRFGS